SRWRTRAPFDGSDGERGRRDPGAKMRDDSVERREPDDDGNDTCGDDGGCDAEYEREPGRSRANGHRGPPLPPAAAGLRLGERHLRAPYVVEHHAEVGIAMLGSRFERRGDDSV